jgi:photosystem II stability/assembly factor-like uncharacterized protein
VSAPLDLFDVRARDLTRRLLRARELQAATPAAERHGTVLVRIVAAVAATALIGGSIVLASRALHAGTSSPPPVTVPAGPTPVQTKPSLAPTPPPQSECDSGTRANGTCVQPTTTIQFVSRTQGWLVGPRSVVATTDGGRHWTTQLYAHEPLMGADFLDASHGWVVGATHLFVTSDGTRWEQLDQPHELLWSVHFASATHGWAIAGGDPSGYVVTLNGVAAPYSGGRLLSTSDGGHSWISLGAVHDAQSVCFADQSNGWVGTPGAVYRSSDGGLSWHASYAEPPVPPGGQPADSAFVQCSQPPSAWVMFIGNGAALSHRPYVSFAAPDGVSWHPVVDEPYTESGRFGAGVPPGPGSYPGPFSLISATSAMYLGYTPPALPGSAASMMLATEGGAKLSTATTIPPAQEVVSAAFISADVGWIVSDVVVGRAELTVLATADGGRSWSVQFSAPR